MAIKGLSIPVFGKYNYDPETEKVTYTDGVINPHAVSYSVEFEETENNPLFADNRIVENDYGAFNTGTYSLEVDDLVQEVSKFLFNVKEVERTYGEGKTVTTLVYDDDQKSPALGVGIIETHQNNGLNRYKAIILKKVTFNIPGEAATTKGASVEWQTKTIEAVISRSDEVGENGTHAWKEDAWFDKESEAIEFLKFMLGVAEPSTKSGK